MRRIARLPGVARSPTIHVSTYIPDRLPVLKVALRAYRRTWLAIPALARFAAMPFVLLLIVEGGFRQTAHAAETWVDVTILGSLMSVLTAAILTPVTVAAYRLFMFGARAVKNDAIDDFPPGTTHILAMSLVFAVGLLPFGDMLTLMDYEAAMLPGVALAYHAFVVTGLLLSVLVLVRSIFLFNYAAMGHDLNVSQAWRQTAGNGWRLLLLFVLVQFPLWGAMVAIEEIGLSPLGGAIDFGVWSVWPALVGEVLCTIAMAVLLAAAATFSYGHLTGFPVPSAANDKPFQHTLPFGGDPPSGAS